MRPRVLRNNLPRRKAMGPCFLIRPVASNNLRIIAGRPVSVNRVASFSAFIASPAMSGIQHIPTSNATLGTLAIRFRFEITSEHEPRSTP